MVGIEVQQVRKANHPFCLSSFYFHIEFAFLTLLLLLGVVGHASATPASTAANAVEFKASWQGINFVNPAFNQSILNSSPSDAAKLKSEGLEILETHRQSELKQRLEDLNRDYEMRHHFGLVPPELEIAHTHQVAEFSKSVVEEVQSQRLEREERNVTRWLNQMRKTNFIRTIEKPVGFVLGLVSAYFGEPVSLSLSEDFQVRARAEIASRGGQLHIHTHLVDGVVDVFGRAPANRDPSSVLLGDPTGRSDERLRASLSSRIPGFNLIGRLSYASTSNLIGASLTKQIIPHLGCSFNYYFPLDPANSDVKTDGENVKLSYDLNF